MKLDKKGMTLIEIVVVLVISSLILVVAGTVILNGFGYFDKTERADKDKYAVDKIAELVHDELVYTSEVVVNTASNKDKYKLDEGWHRISIDNGRLNKDGQALFNEDFYQNRKLTLDARIYKNDYRIDLTFTFKDVNRQNEKEYVYKTSTTLELINLKSQVKEEEPSYFKDEILGEEGYNIYYRSNFQIGGGYDDPSDRPPGPNDSSGTVADQIECMVDANNRGEFKPGYYSVGDFVFVKENGVETFYRCLVYGHYYQSDVTGDAKQTWKVIDQYHHIGSPYLVGDIVIDKATGTYYKCIERISNVSGSIGLGEKKYWALIEKPTESNELCDIPGLKNPEEGTVADKDDGEIDIPLYESIQGQVPVDYFVIYSNEVWRKMINGHKGVEPGGKVNGEYIWQKIQVGWDEHSMYIGTDVIIYENNYYRAKEKIQDGRFPASLQNGKWIVNQGWEPVYRNSDGGWSVQW